MLLNLKEYHRPAGGLDEVIALLARREVTTRPLAGGDTLVGGADPSVEAVVDLQALGLDTITEEAGGLFIGATVTRTALAESEPARRAHGGVLAEGAHQWGGNVQRNRATVGGAVAAAAANDPLVVALLACDAEALLYGPNGPHTLPLLDFIAQRAGLLGAPSLITALRVPPQAGAVGAAMTQVGRTPRDAPIVVAAASVALQEGRCVAAWLALGGVAETPLRLTHVEAALVGQALSAARIETATAGVADLVSPSGDFRGSAEYRRAMAAALSQRALVEAWERAQ